MVAWAGIMMIFAVAGIALALLLCAVGYRKSMWVVSIGVAVLLVVAFGLFEAAGLGSGHRLSELSLGLAQCISVLAFLWFCYRLFLCWRQERFQKVSS